MSRWARPHGTAPAGAAPGTVYAGSGRGSGRSTTHDDMSRKLFQYHPVFGYQFIPGVKARIDHEGGGYLVRVNEAGFRSQREFAPAKTADTFRVLLFGDSATAGDGCSNKNRYSDVLEELVPGIEVYNFGLPGTGTDQQYLIHREIGRTIEHDLVVIAVQAENIRRIAARFRAFTDDDGRRWLVAKPYFTLEGGHLTLHHVPPPKEPIHPDQLPVAERDHVDWAGHVGERAWLRKAVTLLGPGAKDWAQKVSRYQPLPEFDHSDQPAWTLMRAILDMWIGQIKMSSIVFPIPVYAYVEETSSADGYQARFRELSGDARVIVHDPLGDLRRYPRDERRRFRFERDAHPSPRGHRALAESLAPVLRTLVERKDVRAACR